MRRNTLDLSCIVNKLHFNVEFYNQDRQIQGYCILPFPEPQCYSFNRRTRLIQNKNVTKLTVMGINSKINGLWSCHHGTNIGKAAVNISVVDVQGNSFSFFVDLPAIIGKLYRVIKKLHRLPIICGS